MRSGGGGGKGSLPWPFSGSSFSCDSICHLTALDTPPFGEDVVILGLGGGTERELFPMRESVTDQGGQHCGDEHMVSFAEGRVRGVFCGMNSDCCGEALSPPP